MVYLDSVSNGATTLPWLQLAQEASRPERAIARGYAARLPLLLAPELDQVDWAYRRMWDVRLATEFGDGLAGVDLMDLASRLGRILITSDSAFLDDGLFPPEWCPGVIVVDQSWHDQLDEFLVTIVGLIGPFPALYDCAKVHGRSDGELTIASPEGSGERLHRRFLLDEDSLPVLSPLNPSLAPMSSLDEGVLAILRMVR